MTKQRSNWAKIKTRLEKQSRKDLLNQLKDIYELDDKNSRFLEARFLTTKSSLAPYKKIISRALYPDVFDHETVSLATARKAISDFKKASGDITGLLELMVFYVEQGNDFTLEYGDMDEQFYSSLESMFDGVIKLLLKSDQKLVDLFLPRLQTIVKKANGMGWGYYDYIAGSLDEAFPEADLVGNL